MRLVQLTRFDGKAIWLNPARVLFIEDASNRGGPDGSDVRFSLHDDDFERVKESPKTVAGLLLEPLR